METGENTLFICRDLIWTTEGEGRRGTRRGRWCSWWVCSIWSKIFLQMYIAVVTFVGWLLFLSEHHNNPTTPKQQIQQSAAASRNSHEDLDPSDWLTRKTRSFSVFGSRVFFYVTSFPHSHPRHAWLPIRSAMAHKHPLSNREQWLRNEPHHSHSAPNATSPTIS